ncbi:MAG: hypothetical protein H0V80_12480 [Acidobacteria bacterium]|nr:hypothetical protein [Acidobacteriota bacterium]
MGLSRGRQFSPQGLASTVGRTEAFSQVLDAMPIAVIGTPWQTAALLPGVSALAHETGHVVETDFGLDATVSAAIAAATTSSGISEGWSTHWQREVFADVFACYVAGPSFVWWLADAVPDSPETVSTLVRPSGGAWGAYPPASLRMLMNVHALRTLGQADEADRVEAYWKAAYPAHAMGTFEKDIPQVVQAVYAAAGLPRELGFRRLDAQRATIYARTVKRGTQLLSTEVFDPRAIVAVAADVHRERPTGVDRPRLWAQLQTHIVESRPAGKLDGQPAEKVAAAPSRRRTDAIAALLFDHDESMSLEGDTQVP